jgi:hypothetical protein
MRIHARTNGVLNVTGAFTYTYHRSNGENEMEILLDNNAQLNAGGGFSATIGNNNGGDDHFDLRINNAAQLNVTGTTSLIAQNSTPCASRTRARATAAWMSRSTAHRWRPMAGSRLISRVATPTTCC